MQKPLSTSGLFVTTETIELRKSGSDSLTFHTKHITSTTNKTIKMPSKKELTEPIKEPYCLLISFKFSAFVRIKKVLHGLPGKTLLIFMKKNSLSR
jgi:hypothetical protein